MAGPDRLPHDRLPQDRLPHDRQLAKRLSREARASGKAAQRAEQVHRKAVARRERKRIQARRALPLQVALTASWALLTVPVDGGLAVVAGVVGVLQGSRAVGSLVQLRRPPLPVLTTRAASAPPAPPPDVRSAAWPAVRRLEVVRVELTRLLPLVAPAGRDVVTEAWQAAAEAAAALRWQAARLAAVEPHRGAGHELLRPLYDGVACQEALLAAVADLVVASSDPRAGTRLQDATDAVHGLAQGLREVR